MTEPWWLKEEPTEGKPSADRLAEYKGYLRYQLIERGPIKRQQEGREQPAPTMDSIKEHLAKHGPSIVSDVVEAIGRDRSTINSAMYRLMKRGEVEQVGEVLKNERYQVLWAIAKRPV